MIAAKPIAALSSGLLARKGHAKPTMRPQGFHGFASAGNLEDLGWNDMGDAAETAATPAPAPAPMPLPPVLRQREELSQQFEPEPEPEPQPATRRGISLATAQRIGRETARRAGKAAFTLRLDGERHLNLRLASAIDGRSAQQLVTEALDRMLGEMPDLSSMLDQLAQARKD